MSIIDRITVGTYLELKFGYARKKRSDSIKMFTNPAHFHEPSQPCKSQKLPTISQKKIANRIGFNNEESYRQAKYVIRHGIGELLTAMNNKQIAIHTAANIAKQPPEQQIQLIQLNRKIR